MTMTNPLHCTIRLAFVLTCLIGSCTSACWAQEQSYRMPEYAEGDPPPPRSSQEVAQLLAGADKSLSEAEESSDKPLRIVLVAGPKDHGKGEHDYPAWQKAWSPLLAEAPATSVDTAWEFPSQEQIDKAGVLVFYQRGRWDDERAAAIDPFLARGGGLVYIHWAVDGRGQQDEMAKRIGLSALGGGIRYRHGELTIDFTPGTEHPIARNFKGIQWVDESYWALSGDASRINLLGTSLEDGQPQPQFWTVERGRGRVFVSIPGHYSWTFDDPMFRTLLMRGIAWAGHRNVDRFNELATLDARVE
jgi:type 1 glutamine amidotransferase